MKENIKVIRGEYYLGVIRNCDELNHVLQILLSSVCRNCEDRGQTDSYQMTQT